jgi:hypothetical protein
MAMPRVVALLMLTFAMGSVCRSFADEPADDNLPVTIQIHDYWHVSIDTLTRARTIVTAMYEQIGVRTEWTGVVTQSERHPGSPDRASNSRLPIAQVTIIILTPKMATRGHVEDGALGFAAVANEGMGRIAYAIYDRVRDTAAKSAMNEGDLLGFVMAHEIAHLLLPPASHSGTGLMRGHWTVRDLQQTDVLKLGFSPQQASSIRSMLRHDSPMFAAHTASGESTEPVACVAANCDLPVNQTDR